MTNQQDADEEEWEVKPTIVADWEFWQIWEKQGQDGGQMIADFIATEEIALGIVADHAAARRARKLEEERNEIRNRYIRIIEPLSRMYARLGNGETLTNEQIMERVEERVRELEASLGAAHDALDDYNATRALAGCRWCHYVDYPTYDGNGLKHRDGCVLIRARALLPATGKADS